MFENSNCSHMFQICRCSCFQLIQIEFQVCRLFNFSSTRVLTNCNAWEVQMFVFHQFSFFLKFASVIKTTDVSDLLYFQISRMSRCCGFRCFMRFPYFSNLTCLRQFQVFNFRILSDFNIVQFLRYLRVSNILIACRSPLLDFDICHMLMLPDLKMIMFKIIGFSECTEL